MTTNNLEKRIIKRFLEWEYLPNGNFSREWSLWIESTCAPEQKEKPSKAHLSSKLFIQKLHKLGNFANIQQMCSLWSSQSDEQGLPPIGCNFLVFVNGITPAWEDQANSLGGHFIVSLHNREKAEQVWYTLLMTMLTEKLEGFKQTELNGMIISPREINNKIFVWNRFSHNTKFKDCMKSFMVDSLDVPEQYIYYFTNKYKMADAKRKLAQENSQKNEKRRRENQNKNNDSSPPENKQEQQNDQDSPPELSNNREQIENKKERLENQSKEHSTVQSQDENLEEEKEEQSEAANGEMGKNTQPSVQSSIPDNAEINTRDFTPEKIEIVQSSSLQVINVEQPQPNLLFSNQLFTISIGFLIAVALIYNIYVIIQY